MMLPLWIDLFKARKGERVGGKYIHRWWNAHQGKWNYEYFEKPHPQHHGLPHVATSDHTIEVHPSVREGAAPEEAFHQSARAELKGGEEQRATFKDPEGKPFVVHIKPGLSNPIHITSPEAQTAREAEHRMGNLRRFENWFRRRMTVQTVYDAHGNPWFDVRLRGQSGEYRRKGKLLEPGERLSVRYYPDSPYNPYPHEKPAWGTGPFTEATLDEWVREERRKQRAAGQRISPAKAFPKDMKRPATTMMEQGTVIWKQIYQPGRGRGVKHWKRVATNIGRGDRRSQFYARVIQEHFGLIVDQAVRQLVRYNIIDSEGHPDRRAVAQLLGYYGGPGRRMRIQVAEDSPTYRAVERAVNSYDPEKGWRFNTYLGHCVRWEQFKETKKILDQKREQQRLITTTPTGDALDHINLTEAAPGHEAIIGGGAFYQTAEEHVAHEQEVVQDWSKRQEDRISRYIVAEDDPEKQLAAFEALQYLDKIHNVQQAAAFVVHFQSSGGDGFAEPIELREEERKKTPRLTKQEKRQWVGLIEAHPALTSQERHALLAIAPTGDLSDLVPFDEAADKLNKDHPKEFPKKPRVGEIVDIFLNAYTKLAGSPEFEAMQRKLFAVAKAIGILSKGIKRGGKASEYKYSKREGVPGHYRYYYEEPGTGNVIRTTNAPVGHPDHDPSLGTPQRHPSEPDPVKNPEYFDPRSGRKMNRAVPGHAEWNDNYSAERPLASWAARWPKSDPNNPDPEYAYYDSDIRKKEELKYNVDNRHFDAQLPKIRKFYSTLMKSKNIADRALGLMIALLDQAYMRPGKKQHEESTGSVGLVTMKVENAKIRGNVATFSYVGKKGVSQDQSVTLDDTSARIMKELINAPGKSKKDYLFSIPVQTGRRVKFREVGYNRLSRTLATLGVTPKQFRTYHGTEIFSKTFEHMLAGIKGRITPKVLESVTEQAALEVAKALGHFVGKGEDQKLHTQTALKSYIDPVVVRSLYLNALTPDVNKAFKLQGTTEFQGLPISIENKKGSTRKWYDPHEKREGSTTMHFDYGYIRRTEGMDGDHVDVYLGPHSEATTAYVVHQMKGPDFSKFDEDKVMLGFASEDEARLAYLKQYDKPGFFGGITAIPMSQFKEKVAQTKDHPMMLKSFVWFAHEVEI